MQVACSARVGAGQPAKVGVGARHSRCRTAVQVLASHQHDLEAHQAGRRQALLAGGALAAGLLLPRGGAMPAPAAAAGPESIYDLSAFMFGEEVPLSRYRDQVGCCQALSSRWAG